MISSPHTAENDAFLMQNTEKTKIKIICERQSTTPTGCVAFFKIIQEFDKFHLTLYTQDDSIILNFHEYTVTHLLRDDGRCGIPLHGRVLHRRTGGNDDGTDG